MLFYIDYLDYLGSSKVNPYDLAKWLRYDLLVFHNAVLCVSTPACVKLASTTKLLAQIDSFWKNNRIRIQLDKKYQNMPMRYFDSRMQKLEKNIPEESIHNHFEYQAYRDSRTPDFFNVYLGQKLETNMSEILISKAKDTDVLFRENVISEVSARFDDFSRIVHPMEHVRLNGIFNTMIDYAIKAPLFQRSIVNDNLNQEYNLSISESMAINTILDRSFSLANAETSMAIPITLISNQLTGRWLVFLLEQSKQSLHKKIMALTWPQVYQLSTRHEWHQFINCINALIHLFQSSNIFDLRPVISKISHYDMLYILISKLLDQSIQKISDMALMSNTYQSYLQAKEGLALYKDLNNGYFNIIYEFLKHFEESIKQLEFFLDNHKQIDIIEVMYNNVRNFVKAWKSHWDSGKMNGV